MNIVMIRDDCNHARTFGTMRFQQSAEHEEYVCQTLEDPVREAGVKIQDDTAIPSGTYRVIITKSKRFGTMLPLLLDVPNFTGVRIHSGNTTADTSGCILVAAARGQHDDIVSSKAAMEQVQKRIAGALTDAQGVCTIEIITQRVTTSETFEIAT